MPISLSLSLLAWPFFMWAPDAVPKSTVGFGDSPPKLPIHLGAHTHTQLQLGIVVFGDNTILPSANGLTGGWWWRHYRECRGSSSRWITCFWRTSSCKTTRSEAQDVTGGESALPPSAPSAPGLASFDMLRPITAHLSVLDRRGVPVRSSPFACGVQSRPCFVDMLIRIYSSSNISGQVGNPLYTPCPRHPARRQLRWRKALVFFQRIFVSSSCFVDRSACQPRSFCACAWFGDFRRLSSWEVPCISTPYVDHWKAFYLFRSMSQAKRAVKQREVIGALTFQLLTLKTPAGEEGQGG